MNEDLIFVKGYAERFLTKINTKYKSQIKKIIEGKKINKEEMLSDADLKVTEVKVDYNSGSAMRIKYHEEDIETEKDESFAVYYEAMPFTAAEYVAKKGEEKKAKKAKK